VVDVNSSGVGFFTGTSEGGRRVVVVATRSSLRSPSDLVLPLEPSSQRCVSISAQEHPELTGSLGRQEAIVAMILELAGPSSLRVVRAEFLARGERNTVMREVVHLLDIVGGLPAPHSAVRAAAMRSIK
jgi:hypothetical protein